ncbi:protein phosphatase 1D-like [Anneissia japonica]|uniref:protein phosphatase 1D-like n=1 Tax=Anneissia japonica TaxID=1529436 RepID=UPI00142558DB|nr:protein phosphatase 1D-like [Anneissia japonica]
MPEEDNLLTGLRFRISSSSNQGGRHYNEDVICKHCEKTESTDLACFAVFDGHGGREAAVYARDHLWANIKKQPGFLSLNEKQTIKAIKDGFAITQNDMWKYRASWKKTLSGYPSTAGTTCSMAIIIGIKMYIAHVGDSGIVMGYDDEGMINSEVLTIEHKPDSKPERKRIEGDGGLVMTKNGVNRVVWKRPKISHMGPVRRSTSIDCIPFLAVARSLGDLWSYNYESKKYIISPKPDIEVMTLDPYEHKFLVLGTDGLWNMISGTRAVDIVADYERERISKNGVHQQTAAQVIVRAAIKQWNDRFLRADNTTAVVVFIDPMDAFADLKTTAGKLHRPNAFSFWNPPYSEDELYGYVYHRPSVLKKKSLPKVNDHPSLKRSHAFSSDLPSELSPKKPKLSSQGQRICPTCYGYKLLEEDEIEVKVKQSKKHSKKNLRRKAGINSLAPKKMTPMCVTKVIIPTKYKSPEGYSSPNRRCYGEASYVKTSMEDKFSHRDDRTHNTIIIPTKYKTPCSNGKLVRRRCFSAEPVITTGKSSVTNSGSKSDPHNNLKSPTPNSNDDNYTSTPRLRVPLAVKRLKTEQNNQLPETPKKISKVLPSSYTLRRRSDSDLIRKIVTRARSKVIPQITQTRSKSQLTKSIKANVGKVKVPAC